MTPVNIKINNFFSHKDSEIDFTLFDSALLIGNVGGNYDISNGSGKSAIFEAILWSLFNKSRVSTMDDVVFWGENSCKVCFIFKHGEDLYQVIRKRSRMNSVSHVTFCRKDSNGTWIDISGSTPSLTNKAICTVINLDFKTFINSAYFRQNDISEFAETDASSKKGILKSIIDLSKWDNYEKEGKADLREMRGACKILSAAAEGYDDAVDARDLAEFTLGEASTALASATEERNTLRDSLRNMTSKYQEMKGTLDTNQWDKTIEESQRLKTLKAVVLKKISSVSKSLSVIKTREEGIREDIDLATGAISNLKTDDGAEEQVRTLREDVVELRASLGVSITILGELSEREIHKGKCYVCEQNVDDELYDSMLHDHEDVVKKHQRNKIYSQNKINEVKSNLKEYEVLLSNNKKHHRYSANLKTKKAELVITEERVLELSEESVRLTSKMSGVVADLELNEGILNSIRNNDFKDLQKELDNSRRVYRDVENSVETKNRNIGALTEKASNLRDKVKRLKLSRKEYLLKQREISMTEKMVKFLGKNGIQTILLNAVIEDLESTSNEILTSICNEPFVIYLDTQRMGADGVSVVDTLDLRVRKDGIVQNFKSLSGGEKFRIALALRIALSEISSRHGGSSLEFLLLDEINSPLDKQGTESLFVNVIRSLEKKYKILVITHSDSLKEKFDNVIDVTKIGGESVVNYISI